MIIYALLATATSILIFNSGREASPFLALWMFIELFAGIFGLFGLIPMLVTSSIFATFVYFDKNYLSTDLTTILILCGVIPLVLSYIIWHRDDNTPEFDSENKAYRNLEDELTEVASKSEAVIDAIGDGVISVDGKGIIQLINPAARRIIGCGEKSSISLNYKNILRLVDQKGSDLETTEDPLQQVMNINQQIRSNNLSIVTDNGKKVMISLVASPVGEIGSGVIVVFRDITKEKIEEREQAEFISTASHEMRTPVAAIEGYLGLALNENTAQIDDRARNFIQKAHESTRHLGHLFQDLLDISKVDDNRLSNNPKVTNIATFVHDVVQGLEQKANEKNLKLVYKLIPDDEKIKRIVPVYYSNVDNDHLREIINNLVENAIKYTAAGEIIIDAEGDDSRVVISVKDSGIGIPAEDIPHLFQKFYRVDNKDTREIGGTGLGLYLCRRLTEIMSGRIWAESANQNGTTFYVELPRLNSQDATALMKQQAIAEQQESSRFITNYDKQPKVAGPLVQTTQNQVTIPDRQIIAKTAIKLSETIPEQSGAQLFSPTHPTTTISSPTPTVNVETDKTIEQQPNVEVTPISKPDNTASQDVALPTPTLRQRPIPRPPITNPNILTESRGSIRPKVRPITESDKKTIDIESNTSLEIENDVPRSQSLSTEEKKAYVARQRALAALHSLKTNDKETVQAIIDKLIDHNKSNINK